MKRDLETLVSLIGKWDRIKGGGVARCLRADKSTYFSFHTGRAVWHQADPITKGTRWALVVFYAVAWQACATTREVREIQ